jgi:UDP-N-acetyl-D-mannosaminuronic acid dehydrogenase
MKRICVLGLGYIGLPTAAMFAKNGADVLGVDINQDIISILNCGNIHIQEHGLRELVQQAITSGRLRFSLQAEMADAFIIAVPTPFYEDKRADMRAVISAAESIAPFLRKGNLVILESTSPPRTTQDLVRPILERSGLKAGTDFYLSYSPERVLPGQIIRELMENSRVIGGINQISAEAGRDLYKAFVTGEIFLTDATTAEMIKLMENTYRDVNIAIANEFSRLADHFGINIWEAIAVANHHPRVNILSPGPGVGGHCISVDPWFLVEAAPDIVHIIRAAREVNDTQPIFITSIVERAVGCLQGKRITVLGLSFKPNVDDLRESPAVEIARNLACMGAYVVAYEPFQPKVKFSEFTTVDSFEAAVQDSEVVILLVGHTQFCQIDPESFSHLTNTRIIFDMVNGWDREVWKKSGFHMFSLGVGEEYESSLNGRNC